MVADMHKAMARGRTRGTGPLCNTVYAGAMRVPLSKVYRAFPELDRFSDEQCQGWQRLANDYWPWKRVMVICAAIAAFVVASVGMYVVVGMIVLSLPHGQQPRGNSLLMLSLGLGMPICTGALASLGIRDWWARRCLRRFIDDRICGCGYSLLGLPEEPQTQGVAVHCPECGVWHRVDSRTGLTTAQS